MKQYCIVSIAEADGNLAPLVERLEKTGEHIVLEAKGKVRAVIIPVQDYPERDRDTVLQLLRGDIMREV